MAASSASTASRDAAAPSRCTSRCMQERPTVTKRILVIEDEPQMLLGLRDNLELEGYEVVTAADGEDGLAKAISTAPDLVILDVTLPRKNGFEVCRELRARASAPSCAAPAAGRPASKRAASATSRSTSARTRRTAAASASTSRRASS